MEFIIRFKFLTTIKHVFVIVIISFILNKYYTNLNYLNHTFLFQNVNKFYNVNFL